MYVRLGTGCAYFRASAFAAGSRSSHARFFGMAGKLGSARRERFTPLQGVERGAEKRDNLVNEAATLGDGTAALALGNPEEKKRLGVIAKANGLARLSTPLHRDAPS
jgi:hypothetical protein